MPRPVMEDRLLLDGIEDLFQSLEPDWFGKDGNRSCIGHLGRWRPTRNENDARRGIFSENIAASGRPVQFRHPVIHQHHIGLMARVSLDGFQTRTHNFDNFMFTVGNECGECCAYTFLIVRN